MSDLFHNDVPDSYILDVCAIMAACPWHTFQILTKRSSRLKSLLNGPLEAFAHLVHIWWGVSAEDRTFGPPRIKDLQATNVAMRFLSIEPLLEDLGEISLDGIAWLIAGGESGAGARPIKEEWVISLRDQCQKSKVPFFFKQWGGVQKKRHGRLLQGLTYSEMPELIQSAVPNRNFRMQLIDQFSLMAATSCSDGSFPKLAVTHAPLFLIEQVD
jgi:protein gp37